MAIQRFKFICFTICMIGIVSVSVQSSIACTAFMMSDGDKVLVGNNEDYNIPYTRVWFIPSENGQFGRIFFGYENWSPQGDMNDQGLFFDGFSTKPLDVENSKDKPKFKGPILDSMMATCATVEDVLKMFSSINLEFMRKFQLFVVDKTGDAAIIEGDEIVRKSGQYQIVTNFYQSKIPENKRPCEWYRRSCQKYKIAESMIKDIDTPTPTVAHFRNILDATHRETTFSTTLYSNITKIILLSQPPPPLRTLNFLMNFFLVCLSNSVQS